MPQDNAPNRLISIVDHHECGLTLHRSSFCTSWLDHPKQMRYPLKRQNERGENRWESISWEQALDEITAKRQTIKA
jgi:anaerobic selenocysteine-containing dehydrogenase